MTTPRILLLLALAAVPALHAQVTVKMYKSASPAIRKGDLGTYIKGIGDGYVTANVFLTHDGKPPLYCQPAKFSLVADNYLQILDERVAKLDKRV